MVRVLAFVAEGRGGHSPEYEEYLSRFFARHGKTHVVLSQLMGHSTLQMTSRYIANNTEAHVQANQELADKIMPLIQAPDPGNPMESAGAGCNTDALKYSAPYAACQNPPISPKGSKLAPVWPRNGREPDSENDHPSRLTCFGQKYSRRATHNRCFLGVKPNRRLIQ